MTEAESDPEQLARINEKYAIDMDFDSIPELCGRFGLSFQHWVADLHEVRIA